MTIIKFEIEGFVNSIRYEHARKSHRTFLIPPKTSIIGLITNCMGGSIGIFDELQHKLKIGVVLKCLSSTFLDTWSYKLLESKGGSETRATNTGTTHREKLFLPIYYVYIKIEEKELEEMIFNSLLNPKRTTYLGQNDDMIIIKNIEKEEDITETELTEVNSSFYGLKILQQKIKGQLIIPLKAIPTPISYKFKNNMRIKDKEELLYDFCGISVEVERFKGIKYGDEKVFLY